MAESLKRETGARGLQQVLTRHIENAAFESFAEAASGRVRVYLDGGSIRVEADVQGERSNDDNPNEPSPEEKPA